MRIHFSCVRIKPFCLALLMVCTWAFPASAPAATTNKNSIIAPPRRDVPGRHADLKPGTLYVPSFFKADTNGSADIVIFFHGAAWCAEQNFYDARKNAVLITINNTNLAALFKSSSSLSNLLEETVKALKPEGVGSIRHICIASFSGGYVAVREILQQPEYLDRISDVVLADSLYAPRVAGKTNELDPAAMAPFLNYARHASEGKGRFFFSQLFPPEERYRENTTTLAAYYLTDHLHVKRLPATGKSSSGDELLYRADKGNFHVLGYAGMTNQDHFNHFYGISDLLRETSLEATTADSTSK
ncbi:MAG: hypothetical protein JWQ71_1977 [Pedosphaera sp.]|nr:hypothetical protein [Pedosphaera sp.]